MQQRFYTCQNIEHEEMEIQGFCLDVKCQMQKPQFCIKCALDNNIHKNCKNDCKPFSQIKIIVENALQKVSIEQNQLNNSYSQVQIKYTEYLKQLQRKTEILNKIKQSIELNDYFDIRENISSMKEWYQFLNQQKDENQNKLAKELLQINQFQQSLKSLQTLEKQPLLKQSQLEDFLFEGITLLNKKEWKKADQYFSEKNRQLKKYQYIFKFYNSIALVELNQVGLAVQLREKINKYRKQVYEDIEKVSNILLTKNQNDVIGLISKIFVLENGNQLDEALNFCEITLLVDNINLLARYRKSVELLELKQFEEALQVIEEIFKINKNYNAGYFIKGRILQKQKRYNEALDFFNLYLKLDPIKQIGNYHKSLLLYDMKCYGEAIVCLDQCIIQYPKSVDLYKQKAKTLEELKLYEKAIFCYDICIILKPYDSDNYLQKGRALSSLKRWDEANEMCEKSIELDPNNVYNIQMKGAILADAKQYNKALIEIEKALKLDPKNSSTISLKNGVIEEMKKEQQKQQKQELTSVVENFFQLLDKK